MWNKLPPGYKEWLTRVTEIVSFVSPFEWTDWEQRYFKWLKWYWITHKEYITAAQEMWTFVHNTLEYYILEWKIKGKRKKMYKETKQEIEHWKEWLDNLWYKKIETEKYVREKDERFQWAVDLLYTDKDWKIVLADWKTFWICKKRYWINNKFKVDTGRRKKVRLQMSIYCYALRQQWINVDRIELLFLHEEGLMIIELPIFNNEEIESILDSFEKNKETIEKLKLLVPKNIEMKITTPLKITLQTAPKPYDLIKVELDLDSCDNWKTAEQNLNEAIKVQQTMHKAYLLFERN